MKSKRILVTGGAGFVGSNLCERLLREGHSVICADNLYTGSLDNIREFLSQENFEFRQMDILDKAEVEKLKDLLIDEIYHLACPASPVHYQKDAIYTTRVCVEGTINMLELARHFNCPILFSSTSEVYGDPLVHPQREDYYGNVNPNGIRSCYDEGKRCAESLCMDYHRQYGVKVKIIRIFNTYGPRMAVGDGRVVSNFIVQALKNEPMTIYGDGSQTRSFMYIDDLLEGMVRMMATGDGVTGPVNIGNPEEMTIRMLAVDVLENTNPNSEISYLDLPYDDPKVRCPDISQAMSLLKDWKPVVGLNDGLHCLVEYFRIKVSLVLIFLFGFVFNAHSQRVLPLDEAIHECVYSSRTVKIYAMSLQRAMLEYEVYRKSQLPLLTLNLIPVSFSHSMKLLQSYDSGLYANVEDYSNTSRGELLLTQRVQATGGTLTLGSGLNVLHEFSPVSNSFSSMPLYIKYTQDLLGGGKENKLLRKMAELKRQSAIRQFCSLVSTEQQAVLELYLTATSSMERLSFYRNASHTDSILAVYARQRFCMGKMTEYEYKEVELQQLENLMELGKAQNGYAKAIQQLESKLQMKDIVVAELSQASLPIFIPEGQVMALTKNNSESSVSRNFMITSKQYDLHEAEKSNRFNGKVSFTYGLNQYGTSLRSAYTRPNQQQALTLSLSIPLLQHGIGKNRIQMARTEYESEVLEKEKDAQKLEELVHDYVFGYNHNVQLLDIAKRKYDLTSQQYRFAQVEFKLGKLTASELSISYRNSLSAKQEVIGILCDLYQSYYKIRHLALYDFVEEKNLMDLLSTKINEAAKA